MVVLETELRASFFFSFQNYLFIYLFIYLLLLLLLFFFLATPTTCGGSQARDQICTIAVTQTIALTMRDP